MKWVFNSTSGVNKGNLKSKILATLKKADGSAVDELEAIFKENPLATSEKYSTLFRREINSAENIIDALDDDAIFNKLFKTAK